MSNSIQCIIAVLPASIPTESACVCFALPVQLVLENISVVLVILRVRLCVLLFPFRSCSNLEHFGVLMILIGHTTAVSLAKQYSGLVFSTHDRQ